MGVQDVENQVESVGFIGLGDIGRPMCERLVDWPGELWVCDIRPEVLEPFVERGAHAAADAATVAAATTLIHIMVNTEDQVRGVLTGDRGVLSTATEGTVVAIHSTVGPDALLELAEVAARQGVILLDAPVSGGAIGAHTGELVVMVGGPEDAVQRFRPAFKHFSSRVEHMGALGSGIKTKIARNLITFVSFAVVGEAQRLAAAAGLDPLKLGEIVRRSDKVSGGPGAIMIRGSVGEMAADDGLRPIFEHSLGLGTKDLELAMAMGDELGVATPLAELGLSLLPAALGLAPAPADD